MVLIAVFMLAWGFVRGFLFPGRFPIWESVLKIKALKGFKDIVPGEVELWQYLEKAARNHFERFHFFEIRLPILEKTDLFARSIGDSTDIVEKEMYTFVDQKTTMRPEATASLLRAYIEHGLHVLKPVQKLFTIGPMFRRERPQKGRLRQFHQMDVEVLGSDSPRVDVELMAMGTMLFNDLGLDISLEVNSLGCPECRPKYRAELVFFINDRLESLCGNCRRRSAVNPLRVLDCKVPGCREEMKEAPSILNYLCAPCEDHFQAVQDGLAQLDVEFSLNKFMVRGLDYYCRTTFEFITDDLGAQAAVAAGGRYDGLVESLGGPKNTPGIGFAMGMERIILLLQQQKTTNVTPYNVDLFMIGLGERGAETGFVLANLLRKKGFVVAMDHGGRSLKSQMKQADKAAARYALIIGDDELLSGRGILRNMNEDGQREVALTAGDIAGCIQ